MKYLRQEGYEIDWAKDGEEAVELAYANRYDLYLFDINVPLINGVDLLSSLREAEDFTPTIIISALVDVESMTKGFIAGADDYVKKPFDPEELLIRIKAKTAMLKEQFVFRDFAIDLQSGMIYHHDKPLELGDVQKKLLVALIKNFPNPVVKDELLYLLEKPSDLALRVNMTKLKKNVSLEIQSVRGVGYKIL